MPVFEPKIIPGSNLTETDVKEKCQNDKVCQYDYMVTLSAEVASASLAAQAWAEEMTAMSQKGKEHGQVIYILVGLDLPRDIHFSQMLRD